MDGNHARALLGLPENPSIAQVRHGFRRAVLRAHPDQGGTAEWFDCLLTARDTLLAGAHPSTEPATGAPNSYDRCWQAPRRSSIRLHDVRRRIPTTSEETPPTTLDLGTFDSVLASVLASMATTAA